MYKYSLFTMACQILISYSISASSFSWINCYSSALLLSSALSLNLIPIFTAESRLELFLIYQFNNGLYYYGYSKMKVQKLVPTEYNGRWGFLDTATGEEVVPFIYDYAHAFSVGLALVRQNGWWGYVDKTGKKLFLLYMMTPAILIKMAKQR